MFFIKKEKVYSMMAFLLMVLFAGPLTAGSDDFSDDELKKFANSIMQVMTIQQQGQAQMVAQIEDVGLTIERFNELMTQAQELPLEEIVNSEEELEKFLKANERLEAIQVEMEEVLIASIEGEGLTLEKYEEIVTAYQQSPELQQRVMELLDTQ